MKNNSGLVMVNTGQGKGKTTAALGAVVRAVGRDKKVLVLQFIKGRRPSGESRALARLGVEVRPMGLGLIKKDADLEPHRQAARQGWARLREEVASGRWDLVVADELCNALHRGFVDLAEVEALISTRPDGLHLILTGRHCPQGLLDLADTVTEMGEVKHHMAAGVPAQKGIEF